MSLQKKEQLFEENYKKIIKMLSKYQSKELETQLK